MQKNQKPAYKQTRVYMNAQKKLMSAVAMLLVASTLMASSTYAWFTLSTSPEVTGITTTVGSNGNLEIALASESTYNDSSKISSAVGDSMATTTTTAANVTWGNLVDLSDTSYGLSGITLNLASMSSSGSTVAASTIETSLLDSLAYAAYGADGRVASLATGLKSAAYSSDDAAFTDSNGYGVRAVGTNGTVTVGAASYLKTAKAAMNSANSSALSYVKSAFNDYNLFGIAAAYASDETLTDDLRTDYKTRMQSAVADLEKANAQIAESLRQYLICIAMTTSTGYAAYETISAMDLATLYSSLSTYVDSGSIPTTLSSAYESYTTMVSSVASAKSAIDALDTSNATWDDIKSALSYMVDYSDNKMTIVVGSEQYAISKTNLVTYLATMSGININEGSGVFYSYAALLSDYSVKYGAYTLTTTYGSTGALEALYSSTSSLTAYTASSDEEAAASTEGITEFYAYILDFWFRSNEEGTLSLQSEAAARVSNDEDETMGEGSYITLSGDQTESEYLSAITIVFMDSSSKYLATATVGQASYNKDEDVTTCTLSCTSITGLTANTAVQVSVLVYIDGSKVTNKSAADSLTFSMNLQFTTSAELNPMNYSGYSSISSTANTGTGTDTQTDTE